MRLRQLSAPSSVRRYIQTPEPSRNPTCDKLESFWLPFARIKNHGLVTWLRGRGRCVLLARGPSAGPGWAIFGGRRGAGARGVVRRAPLWPWLKRRGRGEPAAPGARAGGARLGLAEPLKHLPASPPSYSASFINHSTNPRPVFLDLAASNLWPTNLARLPC